MGTDTSLYARRVLFNPDGEGLDLTDTNNMQLFSSMREASMLHVGSQPNIIGLSDGSGADTRPESFETLLGLGDLYGDAVFTPWPGSAFVLATAVARQIGITKGPMMLVTDEPWNGGGEEFATFHSGGYLLTTAIGDAAQPRIDLVEVKLSYVDGDSQTRHFEDATTRAPTSSPQNKERRVRFDYQIKQGTPAANPAYPATTAGYVAMAAIYVPALHNAVHSPDNIRDLRIPYGVRVVDVPFTAMAKTGANPWAELGGAILSTAAASIDTDRVIAVCPVGSATSRLLGVGIHASPGDDFTCELGVLAYPVSNAAPTFTGLAFASDDGVFAADGFTYIDAMQIADLIAAKATIKGTRPANRRLGTALWCNGKTAGVGYPTPSPADGGDVTSKIALSFGCDGSGVSGPGGRASFVRFWIAEGL